MNEDVVRVEPPDAHRPAGAASAELLALARLTVEAGPATVARFLEFYAARIANQPTRAAYGRAVGQFLAWCEARGLALEAVSPLRVAAYIRTHPGSAPTVKHHLAAIRMLGDWLVVSQILPVNPGGGRPGAQARRHEGSDAGALAGESTGHPPAHRPQRTGIAPTNQEKEIGTVPPGGCYNGHRPTVRWAAETRRNPERPVKDLGCRRAAGSVIKSFEASCRFGASRFWSGGEVGAGEGRHPLERCHRRVQIDRQLPERDRRGEAAR